MYGGLAGRTTETSKGIKPYLATHTTRAGNAGEEFGFYRTFSLFCL
jgi:hypothetical protein